MTKEKHIQAVEEGYGALVRSEKMFVPILEEIRKKLQRTRILSTQEKDFISKIISNQIEVQLGNAEIVPHANVDLYSFRSIEGRDIELVKYWDQLKKSV